MDFMLIFYAQIILILVETTSSQYEYQNVQNAYYQNPYQNIYQYSYSMDGFARPDKYEDTQLYRRSRKHKRKPYGSSGGRLPLDDDVEESEECTCSCNSCVDVKPCCKDACANCNAQIQPNIVIVPYLYPMVVTQKNVAEASTTTTTTITTTTKPAVVRNTNINFDANPMTPSHRRTKPVWLPRYGIVPIPDHLAEKLMSKLREVKVLKAERTKR